MWEVGMNVARGTLKTCFCLMLSPCWSWAAHCVLHVANVRGSSEFSSKHPIVARGTWIKLLSAQMFCDSFEFLFVRVFRNSPFGCFFFRFLVLRLHACLYVCLWEIKIKHSSVFRIAQHKIMFHWKCALSKHKQHIISFWLSRMFRSLPRRRRSHSLTPLFRTWGKASGILSR